MHIIKYAYITYYINMHIALKFENKIHRHPLLKTKI